MTTPLSDVLNGLLVQLGEDGPHLYARLLPAAITCLRELAIDATSGHQTKVVRYDLDANRTVPLPENWLATTAVLIQVEHTLLPLAPDPHLAPLPPKELDTVSDADAAPAWWGLIYQLPEVQGSMLAPYGLLATQRGTYRVDTETCCIHFGPTVPAPGSVVLVYQADAVLHEQLPVDALQREAVENYCLWKHYLRKNLLGMAREHERLYRIGRQAYLHRIGPSGNPAATEQTVRQQQQQRGYAENYVRPPYFL